MVNLPKDILTDILLSLPVKSLVRFRPVSKSWLALLTSPRFIDLHLEISLARDDEHVLIKRFLREESKTLISIHSDDKSLSLLVSNFEILGHTDTGLKFIGCVNGVVCLGNVNDLIFLFNPSLHEFRTLPPRPFSCPQGCDYVEEGIGFGHDRISNDYKIIRIVWIDHNESSYEFNHAPRIIEIYNLSNDTWRQLDFVLPPIGIHMDPYRGFNLFLNGRINWQAEERDCFILSFDISTEMFHEFLYPEAYTMIDDEEMTSAGFLTIIHDTLSVILLTSMYSEPHQQFINIWMMKEYDIEESWSKQYSIGPLSGILRPISIWKNECLLLERVTQEDIGKHDVELVACDLLNRQQLQNYDVYGFQYTLEIVFYKASLVSVTRFLGK